MWIVQVLFAVVLNIFSYENHRAASAELKTVHGKISIGKLDKWA